MPLLESGNTRGAMNSEPGFEVEGTKHEYIYIYIFSCESNLISVYWIYINKESKKKERKDINNCFLVHLN